MTATKDKVQNNRLENRDGKVFNFRPITFFAAFLALGIFCAYQVVVEGNSPWWTFLALPLSLLVALGSLRINKWLVWLPLLLVVTAIGYFSFTISIDGYTGKSHYDGRYSVTGVVTEKVSQDEGYLLTIEDVTIDGKAEKGRLSAYLPATFGENVRLSEQIVAYGRVRTNVSLKGNFGFRASMVTKDLAFHLTDVESLQRIEGNFHPFLSMRQHFYDVLQSGMSGASASFSKGLLLGDDSSVNEELLNNVRNAGIAHLFAVSGLHVGVLFGLCTWLTKRKFFLDRGKISSFLFVGAVLVLYGGICGFSASVVRAIVTCLVAYAHLLAGQKRDLIESVSLAAIFVLLLFPASLFEAGFLLSFAACYGILLLSRGLTDGLTFAVDGVVNFCKFTIGKKQKTVAEVDIFKGDTSPKSIGERAKGKTIAFIATTVSAWLATAPVSLHFFHSLSVWGLLLNCIFVPVLSAFFTLLLALACISCLLPFAAPVLLYVPNLILSPVIFFFEMLSFSGVAIKIPLPTLLCYYGGLLLCTDKIGMAKGKKRIVVTLLGVIFVVCLLLFNVV